MSTDTPFNDLPQETPATQTSLETFNAFLNAPVTKLDADEYMAKDIDGVTESLLGSGNMNFLMMQAGQTDEAIANTNPFDFAGSDANLSPSSYMGGNSVMPAAAMGTQGDFSNGSSLGMGSLDGGASSGAGGMTAASAESALAAISPANGGSYYGSSSFSDTGTGTNGGNGGNGSNGGNGLSGTSGYNGGDGLNGSNGIDGNGGGDTIINNTTNNTTNNVTNNVTNITENTLIDNTNTQIITENIFESVENIYNDTTNLLTEVVNNVTDIVNNTINNIFDGNPLDVGPIGISLDATLDDILHLDLDFINGDQILSVLDEVIDLSPVTNLVEGLTGDILANVGLDVILDPFQYDNSPNDYDVHVGLDLLGLDLPSIDVPLDAVEFLVGDIDIGLDVGQDILGLLPPLLGGADNGDTNLDIPVLDNIALLDPVTGLVDGLFNPIEDLAGDLDILVNLHVDLLNLGTDSAGTDTDLTVPLDLNLIGSDLLTNGIEVSLDPVENLLGDIDIDLGVAGNLLGDTADGLIDNLAGGTGTENILSNLGDTLGGVVDGILSMEGTPGDTDILLNTGLDIPGAELLNDATHLMLDPVENIVGDIDITGDVGINLFDTGDACSAGDTDLSLDIAFIDSPIEVNLDLVESIVGDIDLGVNMSADLFDPSTILDNALDTVANTLDTAIGLLDGAAGYTGGLDLSALLPSADGGDCAGGLSSWTETLLPDAGNLLGDGLLGGLGDILPDPVAASPVIPLPIIPIIHTPPAHGGGLFGGLFG